MASDRRLRATEVSPISATPRQGQRRKCKDATTGSLRFRGEHAKLQGPDRQYIYIP